MNSPSAFPPSLAGEYYIIRCEKCARRSSAYFCVQKATGRQVLIKLGLITGKADHPVVRDFPGFLRIRLKHGDNPPVQDFEIQRSAAGAFRIADYLSRVVLKPFNHDRLFSAFGTENPRFFHHDSVLLSGVSTGVPKRVGRRSYHRKSGM